MGRRWRKLLKQLHRTEFIPGSFADARGVHFLGIEYLHAWGWFNDEEYRRARKPYEDIPMKNTFIHQDFHTGNVMVQDGEMVIIDVDDSAMGASRPGPVLDLPGVCLGWAQSLMGLGEEELGRLWNVFLSDYFGGSSPGEIEEIERNLSGYAAVIQIERNAEVRLYRTRYDRRREAHGANPE